MSDRKITVEQACAICGCGKSLMYLLLNANEILSWKIGRKRVVSEASVYEYLSRQSTKREA